MAGSRADILGLGFPPLRFLHYYILKSATNSHADYYCCLDTLFDDSLATSGVTWDCPMSQFFCVRIFYLFQMKFGE